MLLKNSWLNNSLSPSEEERNGGLLISKYELESLKNPVEGSCDLKLMGTHGTVPLFYKQG